MSESSRGSEKRANSQEEAEKPDINFASAREVPAQSALAPGSGDGESEPAFEEIQGVYIISVAARLLDMHPQTLRKYERLGLISPSRTVGMLRLYSQEDIEKIRLIRYLENDLGMNLAGVEFTLTLVDQLFEMQSRLRHQARVRALSHAIEIEIKRLFQALNLPFSE